MTVSIMHDRVLIKKIEPEPVSSGGILLAGNPVATFEAIVVGVGTGKPLENGLSIPPTVAVGDQVIYDPGKTISLTIKGENLLVIKEEDIFAVIDRN